MIGYRPRSPQILQCEADECRGCVDCMPLQECPGCGEETYFVADESCLDCGPIVECAHGGPTCDAEPMTASDAHVVDGDYVCLRCFLAASLDDGRAA